MLDFQDSTILGAVLIIAEIIGVLTAMHAVMQPRSSQGATAWFIALITFPVLTVPIYAVFGRTRFLGYAEALREAEASVGDRVRTWADKMNRMAAEPCAGLEVIESLAHKLTYIPFLRANHVELLVDGMATYDSMIDAIASADSYVLVQFYIVRDDVTGRRLRDVLIAKVQSGVRVYFLYDEIGCIKLPQAYLDLMRDNGIEV